MGKLLKVNLAWIAASIVLLIVALSYIQAFQMKNTVLSGEAGPWYMNPIWSLPAVPAALIGGLLASRRAGSHYGWVWIGLGAGNSLSALAQQSLQSEAYLGVTNDLLIILGIFTATSSWSLLLVMIGFAMLLFPTGRPPTRRWNLLFYALSATWFLLITFGWLTKSSGFTTLANPIGISGTQGDVIGFLSVAAVLIIFLGILLSAFSLILRYWRASGIERQQIKWFVYSSILMVVVFLLTGFGDSPIAENLGGLLQIISLGALPVAVGVAVLRYRLYDIDIIIRRTLVYTLLTGSLAIIYYGSVLVLQDVFRILAQEESPMAIIISTLAIAALFSPLKRRLQSTIDRRFYRRKYNTAKSLETLAATLKDEVDMESLSDRLVQVVDEAIQPEHVSLWLR